MGQDGQRRYRDNKQQLSRERSLGQLHCPRTVPWSTSLPANGLRGSCAYDLVRPLPYAKLLHPYPSCPTRSGRTYKLFEQLTQRKIWRGQTTRLSRSPRSVLQVTYQWTCCGFGPWVATAWSWTWL